MKRAGYRVQFGSMVRSGARIPASGRVLREVGALIWIRVGRRVRRGVKEDSRR